MAGSWAGFDRSCPTPRARPFVRVDSSLKALLPPASLSHGGNYGTKANGMQLRQGLPVDYHIKYLTALWRCPHRCLYDEGYGRAENPYAKTDVQGVGIADPPEDRTPFLTLCDRRYCRTIPQVSSRPIPLFHPGLLLRVPPSLKYTVHSSLNLSQKKTILKPLWFLVHLSSGVTQMPVIYRVVAHAICNQNWDACGFTELLRL